MTYLTKKQKAVYDYLKEYIGENGYAPSIQEMCDYFGKASLNTMHKYVITLEEKGLLKRDRHKKRAIEIIKEETEKMDIFDIPMLGYITDGFPIKASEKITFIKIPEKLMKGTHTFVLKVKGNFLVGECIKDGDYILVESRNRAENGQIAIIRTEGENVIVRKVLKQKGHIMLQNAIPGIDPEIIEEKDLNIHGVILGTFRDYTEEHNV